jgi:hypothetical protein
VYCIITVSSLWTMDNCIIVAGYDLAWIVAQKPKAAIASSQASEGINLVFHSSVIDPLLSGLKMS